VSDAILVHATAIAIADRAVLLRGPPGSGKSDLALRLIDTGARLVADDQAELRRAGAQILVRAPATIVGLIEVRGLGILRVEAVVEAPLAMLVDLVGPGEIERLPEYRFEEVLGLPVPLISLAAFEASAAAKVRFAQHAFPSAPVPAILGR
jgi:HPr kinase/phosphorylase